MVKITHSPSACLLGPEFDDFLYAPIGEEKNGMLLRVVSVLARLGLDPWQEATGLARMPAGIAVERLAGLITTLPDRPADSMAIASSLIARLPRQPDSHRPLADKTSVNVNLAVNQAQALLFIALLLLMLLGNLLSGGSQRLAANLDNARPPTVSENLQRSPSSTGVLK